MSTPKRLPTQHLLVEIHTALLFSWHPQWHTNVTYWCNLSYATFFTCLQLLRLSATVKVVAISNASFVLHSTY